MTINLFISHSFPIVALYLQPCQTHISINYYMIKAKISNFTPIQWNIRNTHTLLHAFHVLKPYDALNSVLLPRSLTISDNISVNINDGM